MLTIEVVLFPVAVVVLILVMFRIQSRSIRDHPLNNRTPGVGMGTAAQIVDAGSVGWPSLLDALSTLDVDPDRNDRGGDSENSVAEALGLRSPILPGRFQPNLCYGTRHGRQVFIRIGIDETYRTGITTRHLRQITVLRADVPVFELVAVGGVPPAESGILAALEWVEALHPSPDVWNGLRVVGGPEGIVASRALRHRIRVQFEWLYDLWLIERIADSLHALPLTPTRLDRSFVVPYGLGRSR